MDEKKWLTEQFEANRVHLRGVAYRMLGSRTEAEDAVQEVWLRLGRSDTSDRGGAWCGWSFWCHGRPARSVGIAGPAIAAVRGARAHLLSVLRREFRTDLPHSELCHLLRSSADGGGQRLYRRGSSRPGRPPPLGSPRRPVWRQASSDCRPARPGGRNRHLRLREPPR